MQLSSVYKKAILILAGLMVTVPPLCIAVDAEDPPPSRGILRQKGVVTVPADTIPAPAHPDSIPYRSDPTLGRQLLKTPAAILHTAILPLKWTVIWVNEKRVFKKLSDFFLNEEGTAGFYPSFSVGGRTDFAGGITYFNRNLFNSSHSLDLTTFYTNPENYKLSFNYKIPPAGNSLYQFDMRGNVRTNDDQDIFIGGNSGSENLEIDYEIAQYSIQADAGYLARSSLLTTVTGGISHTVIGNFSPFTETGEPTENFINTDSYGFGSTTLANAGVSATLDLRKADSKNKNANLVSTVTSSYNFKQTKIRVYSGALLDAGLSYYRSTNTDDYEFLYYFGDWQQFFPLPGLPNNRRLAFRARLEKRYPLGNAAVPFFEQSVLGNPDNLRGYEQDRFRSLGSLLLTLEYRYPIWDTWDAVIFTDQGQVFNQFNEVTFNRFHGSYGTGLRFMTATDFLFRVEIAFSKEGTQSILGFNMNF